MLGDVTPQKEVFHILNVSITMRAYQVNFQSSHEESPSSGKENMTKPPKYLYFRHDVKFPNPTEFPWGGISQINSMGNLSCCFSGEVAGPW